MPELPEVETTRLGLLSLLNQTVAQVIIRQPALRWMIPADLSSTLSQKKLLGLRRRAKYILADFENGTLLLHLGMSGRILLLERDSPPGKHDHFDVQFTHGSVLRLCDPRRFGAVLWAGDRPQQHALLKNLGPEPLDSDGFHAHYLHRQLRHKKSAIKQAIMDSHLVVGVGNIYASESLFRARIHPETPAHQLSLADCEKLVQEIKSTLEDALKAGGSSLRDFRAADGRPGYFQQEYFVYGRTGQHCLVCGTSIQCVRLGQRSTFFCSQCQRRRS